MSPIAIAVILLLIMAVGILALLLLGVPFGTQNSLAKSNVRSMMESQRGIAPTVSENSKTNRITEVEPDAPVMKMSDGSLTLRKRLRYAQWQHLPPFVFSFSQIVVSLIVFLIVRTTFDGLIQILSLASGPIAMNAILNWKVKSRFEKFDGDYPQFLLSLVGLLKTGMNPVQAIDAAAQGLDHGSLVREEASLMLERMRLGVPEEKSIGSFGEDINHPEIELFVQALLLSLRVGGTLSDTLERLARQVRKRQFFRRSAEAAVGLQRGSMWIILLILAGLEAYLFVQWPETITDTWKHPTGRSVAQFGLMMIILGVYWARQVTKIKT